MLEANRDIACTLEGDVLSRFERGEAPPSERSRVLTHLLSGCGSCSDRLRPAASVRKFADPAPSIHRILSRVAEIELRLDAENATADELWRDFQKHPSPRQWTLLNNSARFNSLAFAERLLEAGLDAIYDDPHRALELNQMALVVAVRLDAHQYGRGAAEDLRGRIWARIANSHRASSNLPAADSALATAAELLQAGSGEPLAEAELWYFTASIRRAQRRLDEAMVAIRRSRRIYRLLRDQHLEGRSLLNQAMIHEIQGDLDSAVVCTRKALAQIDPKRDPKLCFAARHAFVWNLMCAGAAEEAQRELDALKPTYLENGDRMVILRMHWLEGRIRRLRGDRATAEASLRQALDGFISAEIPYEAATVALDLSVLFAESGRTHELKPLAAELVEVFQRLGVAREACAALLMFEAAARAEAVTLGFLSQLNDYLGRVRSQPGLVFSPKD